MSQPPSFREELISQIPALQLLIAMGYTYLTPDEALALRDGKKSNVVLEGVLEPWLKAHNQITFKGQTYPFSEANIRQAVETLTREPYDGLLRTNERVYELLTLGTSLKQTIHGDTKSFSLHYVDWQHPENNVYHVTDEFPVEKRGSRETRRPDIVCFVNGIPLVVIECKRPNLERGGGRAVEEAIEQMLRNQRNDEIPNLFVYSQLLLAVSVNDAYFATTGTPKKFWTIWREQAHGAFVDIDPDVHPLINRSLTEADKQHLYSWRENAFWVRRHFDELEAAGDRLPTPQDRTLYSLLRPQRLLHLTYQFIVYDAGVKKIARYQQYFAVEDTIRRVAHLNTQGMRTGGVIWHTTGSGKSLTMVMLAKALALHPNIRNPRVIIVTDRINLDSQIWGTFRACGKQVERAESGKDLAKLIRQGKADLITTVINKFETASKVEVRDGGINIFVLVDEGHRSQYGSMHAKMRQVLEKACYIGFTGTPLLKKDKTTAAKFGGFIHKYTMRQGVEDSVVAPLLYEGRMAELAVDQEGIDKWFERVTKDLTDEQKLDLKRKFSRA
ncbi:MAG: HsdR family type I site-specific deoxyribonuclease, partial [Desulfobacterales bacterium]|nr:HsdR family type I site-specific deoxyribonuclease [Desulfobacterales bacterium]